MFDKGTVNGRIKAFLVWKNIPQRYIADKLYISVNSLNGALNGRTQLTVNRYVDLCAVLEVPQTYFLDFAHWQEIPEYCFYYHHLVKGENRHV